MIRTRQLLDASLMAPASTKKLVGGWTTQPKNMRKSNWIISPGIGVKIKNSWNHHLNNLDVFAACLFYHATFPPLSTPPLIWWFFWSLCKKHEKATLPTIWRCISYTKRGFSIAMLAYRRVSGKLSWTWFWKKNNDDGAILVRFGNHIATNNKKHTVTCNLCNFDILMSQRKLNLQLINNSPGFCDMCWRCWFQYHLGISWTPNQWHIPPFYSGIVLWHVLYAITLHSKEHAFFFFSEEYWKSSKQKVNNHLICIALCGQTLTNLSEEYNDIYAYMLYSCCIYHTMRMLVYQTCLLKVQDSARGLSNARTVSETGTKAKIYWALNWYHLNWHTGHVTHIVVIQHALLEKCVRKEQLYIKCGKYTRCMITQLVAIPATQWLDWPIWCRHVHWCISEKNGVTSAKRLAVFRHVAQTGPQLKSAQTDLSMLRMG